MGATGQPDETDSSGTIKPVVEIKPLLPPPKQEFSMRISGKLIIPDTAIPCEYNDNFAIFKQ